MSAPHETAARFDRTSLAGVLSVLIGALLITVYWPAFGGPFLLDDISNVPRTRPDGFGPGALFEIASGNHSGLFGRSVPTLTFALNYLFGADAPTAFKITNLAIHALNTALVFLFCRIVLSHVGTRSEEPTRLGNRTHAAAFVVAAIWALHPLQVSTVMYVVQRMTLMMSGFTLLSLTLYALMRTRQIRSEGRGWPLVPPIAFFILLACLSKENGVLALPHIVLLEAAIFRFETRNRMQRRAFLIGFAALVVLPICLGALLFAFEAEQLLAGYAIRDFDLFDRLRTQPAVMLLYLKMSLAPDLGDMSFYHDGFPIRRALDVQTLVEIGAVVSLASLVPLTLRRAPVLSYGIGFFLVSHLLESTILPLEIAFEHRNYMGMAGLALPLVWYATRIPRQGLALSTAATLIVALLSVQTYARSVEWSSALSIHAAAAASRPESIRAGTTLAVVLAQNGRIDESLARLEAVKASAPDEAYPHLLSLRIRQWAGGDADAGLEPTLRMLAEGSVDSHVGQLLESMHMSESGAGADGTLRTERLISLYDAALSNPEGRLSAAHRGALHARHADMLARLGRFGRATEALEAALESNPGNTEIRLRLAERLSADGASARAERIARSVLALPRRPDAETSARARKVLAESRALPGVEPQAAGANRPAR